MKKSVNISVSDYLKRPYARVLIPESDGTFRAEIMEFPGCLALGDTPQQALDSLERVAESWLEATIERRQKVPEPNEWQEYSGRFVVRLPKSTHRKAARFAAQEGVSLNTFVVAAISVQIGEKSALHVTGPSSMANSVRTVLVHHLYHYVSSGNQLSGRSQEPAILGWDTWEKRGNPNKITLMRSAGAMNA